MLHRRGRARAVRAVSAVVALAGAIVLTLALVADSQPALAQEQPLAITIEPDSGPSGTTATVTVTGLGASESVGIVFMDRSRQVDKHPPHDGTFTTQHTFTGCPGDIAVDAFAQDLSDPAAALRPVTGWFTITDPPCDGTSLRVGANAVVYTGMGLPVEEALGDALPAVERIWRFDNGPPGRWLAWDPGLPITLQGFTFLNPSSPYIVMASAATTWSFRQSVPRDLDAVQDGAVKVTLDPVAGPSDTEVTITVEGPPGQPVRVDSPGAGAPGGSTNEHGRFITRDRLRGCRGDVLGVEVVVGASGLERTGWALFTVTDPPCTTVDLVAGINSVAYTGLAATVDEALGDDLLDCCEVSLWQLTDTWLLWSEGLPPSLQGFQELTPNTLLFVDIDRPGQWNMPVGGPGGIFAEGPEGIAVLPSEGPSGTAVQIDVRFNSLTSGLTPVGGAPITVGIGSDVREIGVAVSPEPGISTGEITYSTSFTALGCRGPVPIEAEIAIPGREPVILTSSFTITDPPCPGEEEEEPAQPSTLHIESIDTGGVHRPGVSSDPVFCLTVADDFNNPAEGATVTGQIGGSTVSGITDADGRVDLFTTVFVFGSYQFTLLTISHPTLMHDPDADVATSATVELAGGQPNVFGCAVM